jgi:DNA-binding CsgD family transcriptional regulator
MDADGMLLQLIDGLYRSAVEPAVWELALQTLVDTFRSEHGFLFTTKTAEVAAPFLVTTGISDEDRARYLTPEADRAWAPMQVNIPSGTAGAIHKIIQPNDYERSEFYNEIVKPTRCFYSGFLQQDRPDLSFHLALCRPRRQGLFEAHEMLLLNRLLPHVTTAMDIRQRLHRNEQQSNEFAGLIEGMERPAILVDARCRPIFVNARASQLLDRRGGVTIVNNQLQGANAAQTARLHSVTSQVATREQALTERVYLSQSSSRLPLVLDVMPIWRLGLSSAGIQSPRVAIIFGQPGELFVADRIALQDVFRLTPRESEIAAVLANGTSVEALAAQLGITPGTVRYNLQRVFEKTGVHTQGALVALVRSFGHRADNTRPD